MTVIYRKNFSRRQVDCAEYSGDLVFEECNLSQGFPDTGQGAIFINTDALTSLTCRNCNCVNHRQPPQGGVIYEGCNTGERDFAAEVPLEKVTGLFKGIIRPQLLTAWLAIGDYFVANPTATKSDFEAWFISNQGHTVFYSDTFITAIGQAIHSTFGSGITFVQIRDWIINNRNASDFDMVVL